MKDREEQNRRQAQRRRLGRLLSSLRRGKRLLVMTHDNPDPDSIASALALQRIARDKARIECDIGHGGIVGRGENRAMLRSLGIRILPRHEIDFTAYDLFALVDTQPLTGNNSLPAEIVPDVVLDHHPMRPQTKAVRFHDIRRSYGATTTMAAEYLFAARLKVDRALATALFYGIKSETQSLGRESSPADKSVYMRLFPLVDAESLWKIEHSPLNARYFAMMVEAIQGTRVHGNVAIAALGNLAVPEMVAEFADLLMRLEGIEWTFCFGLFKGDLYLSLRTCLRTADAGEVIQRIVGKEGTAGGHGLIAGGRIKGEAFHDRGRLQEEDLLRQRLLAELKTSDATGVALLDMELTPPGAV